jgi:hypothetical protein
MFRLTRFASCIAALLLATGIMKASELTHLSKSNVDFSFFLQCEAHREYLIQGSTNLIDWEPLLRSIGPSTNPFLQLQRSNDLPAGSVFFRAARTNEPLAVVAKQRIILSGGASIDSFDSSDPSYSSNGLYTILRRRDGALVASLSGANPAIDLGSGKIYGRAATGVGGTVAGTVGDGTWNSSMTGLQPGHIRDDFNMTMADVSLPADFGSGLPLPVPNASGQHVLMATDYRAGSFNVGAGMSIVVSGPGRTRLYFTGDFSISASGFIKILPYASFEIYLGGGGAFSGGGIANETLLAGKCRIYGLPSCPSVIYSGSAPYVGTIYAPQAAFSFSGLAGGSGSFVANTITVSGSAGIHYDEALQY